MLEPTKKDTIHIGELASDSENPEKIELIFRFVFQEKPTYEEIKSHTPNIYPVFALQSQQKNPPEGEFLENLGWQPGTGKTHTLTEMFDRWVELFLMTRRKVDY